MTAPEAPHRPHLRIVLTGPAEDSWDIELPGDIAISRIIARLVRESAFDLRSADDRGNLIKYQLIAKRLNLSLEGDKTLLQAGILNGDILEIVPIRTAGRDIPQGEPIGSRDGKKVFVVHGHDDAMREAVARFLEKIGFVAVLLSENVNRGRTIIEKFEYHSDVKFAVILLSPDDTGSKAGTPAIPRARQNVILEWGYFLGRLGRDRAFALKKADIELPSDVLGILWESFDNHGLWKIKLARELDEAGYELDWRVVARA